MNTATVPSPTIAPTSTVFAQEFRALVQLVKAGIAPASTVAHAFAFVSELHRATAFPSPQARREAAVALGSLRLLWTVCGEA